MTDRDTVKGLYCCYDLDITFSGRQELGPAINKAVLGMIFVLSLLYSHRSYAFC
jgi:hypothetical protein